MSGVNFVHTSEKLEAPEPTRGGIVPRLDGTGERHIFAAPTGKPRQSRLGLDQLAKEKREEQRQQQQQRSRRPSERDGPPDESPPRPSQKRRWEEESPISLAGSEIGEKARNEEARKRERSELEEEYRASELEFERRFYSMEESETIDEGHEPDRLTPLSQERLRQKEAGLARRQSLFQRNNPHARQRRDDQARWEETQLRGSGVLVGGGVRRGEGGVDEEEKEEDRVHTLLVKALRPPFLDGRTLFTRQLEPVSPVRDPASDMAKLARTPSALLTRHRQQRERQRAQPRYWDLAGSTLGNLLGVPAPAPAPAPAPSSAARAGAEDSDSEALQASRFGVSASSVTTAVSAFARSKTIREQRESLPIFEVREQLLRLVQEHQVLVLVGETGSGKTTQLTQYLYEAGLTRDGRIIGCTQPRRVAAMSVARRVAEEMGVELGREVGYSIRFEDVTSEATRIKYMTDGMLLRELLHDPDLDRYAALIMDEAHERSLNTDVLFGVLRRVVARRRDLRLIVTSATMDAERFAAFFGGAPVFVVPGRTFPVEIVHDLVIPEDYLQACVQQVVKVHMQMPLPGDILVFLTGQEDIEALCEIVPERLAQVGEGLPELLMRPIYSTMPADLQARIFEPAPPGKRKCVVATNIAETSITVDGIKYVIDSGLCKLKVFNARIGIDSLQVTPISQANARQRAGRAGRTAPGVCFRMYTERAYRDELLPSTVPEIQRANLGSVVLLLKSLGVGQLLEFDFMDPPPQDTLVQSLHQLWMLGALDAAGELTPLGRRMAEFPLDPPLARMILEAERLGCAAEALTIVSMLSVPSVFFRPRHREAEADQAREKLFVPESDHLTLLNVYQQWKRHDHRADWCQEHFIQLKAMRRVREVRAQLVELMRAQKLSLDSAGSDWDLVRRALAAAYVDKVARLKGIGEYVNMRTGVPCYLHPTSALYGLGFTPDYVVYHELTLTTKEYMQCVTAVDPVWLAEAAPNLFTLRDSFLSRFDRRRLERDEQRRLELEAQQRELELLRQREEREERRRLAQKAAAASASSSVSSSASARSANVHPRRPPSRIGL